jgi:hypothetical protein
MNLARLFQLSGRRRSLKRARRVPTRLYLEPLEPRNLLDARPLNVLVNDPAKDLNNDPALDTQNETSVVLGAGSNVVVAYNDQGLLARTAASPPSQFMAYSLSTDGGASFPIQGTLPPSPNNHAGDPVLARSSLTGTIFLADISTTAPEQVNIDRSVDNGPTFAPAVNGAPGFVRGVDSQDKEWLTVDNFPGLGQGNVYLVWRDFSSDPAKNRIFFTGSTDDGLTWGPSGGTVIGPAGGGNQGANLVVGPQHEIYVFWWQAVGNRVGNPQFLNMRKSMDFGATFGPTVTVANLSTINTNGTLGLSVFRINSFPQAAVNPANGDLYVVYNQPGAGLDRGDIFFKQSTDGGATWSAPVRVNNDATSNDQWSPTLAVTPDGNKVGIFWYDRRRDPANNLIDWFGVVGTVNDSITFGPNFRVSDVNFPPAIDRPGYPSFTYMGDYDQATADNNFFYVTWGDNRLPSSIHPGNQADVRLAKVPVAGIDTAGPSVTAASPSGAVFDAPVNSISFTFSDPMNTSSFSLAGSVSSFTGPGGVDLRGRLTSFSWLNGTRLQVNFDSQTAQGLYNMTIGPRILRAADGAPMDQDFNDIPGEAPGDRFTARFGINTFGPDRFGYTASVQAFEAIGLTPGAPGVFTILANGNNGFAPVDLGGNTVNLYGTVYQSLFVGAKGLITFGNGVSPSLNEEFIFNPRWPSIAPLWSDWRTNLNPDAQVLGKFVDDSGNGFPDQLIIEWHQVQHFPGSRPVTFQAILELNAGTDTSDIVFNYPDLDTGDANANGATATVGIAASVWERADDKLLVSLNSSSPLVGSGKAMRLSAPRVGGSIRGQVVDSVNHNGLAGWTVYLDQNRNGVRDPGEPFTITAANGNYTFTGLVPGLYTVAEEVQPGWVQSLPAGGSRVLDDFESHSNINYDVSFNTSAATATVRAVAAHDGRYGLRNPNGTDWTFRNDSAALVAQGDTLSAWVQLAGAANGRADFGFGATTLGTLSLSLDAVNNQLLVQQNMGYQDFPPLTLGAVPQTYSANKWYRVEVAWNVGGGITGRLFDSDGTTLLNTVTGSTNAITSGGIAFHAFGSFKYFDTVTAVSSLPGAYTLNLGPRQSLTDKVFGVFQVTISAAAPVVAALPGLTGVPGVAPPALATLSPFMLPSANPLLVSTMPVTPAANLEPAAAAGNRPFADGGGQAPLPRSADWGGRELALTENAAGWGTLPHGTVPPSALPSMVAHLRAAALAQQITDSLLGAAASDGLWAWDS